MPVVTLQDAVSISGVAASEGVCGRVFSCGLQQGIFELLLCRGDNCTVRTVCFIHVELL